MCYISTLIDLKLGILFVESPHCKEKLQIKLESDSSFAGGYEMDIHTQRYVLSTHIIILHPVLVYSPTIFKMHLSFFFFFL